MLSRHAESRGAAWIWPEEQEEEESGQRSCDHHLHLGITLQALLWQGAPAAVGGCQVLALRSYGWFIER